MYKNLCELQAMACDGGVPLWRIVLDNECQLSQLTQQQVLDQLESRYEVMYNSTRKALDAPIPTVGGLISGISAKQYTYAQSGKTLCGDAMNRVMAYALSCSEVNASMGKICAAPTAGACGIIPAVLFGVAEAFSLSKTQVLHGLLTASGIGAVIMKNATVAGAEGGCQAECGVAAAMAAGAAVEMMGGAPQTVLNACGIALMNSMGLVCDPVAGLVQIPCAQRNASQAMNGLLSADLALGGMDSCIPADEIVDAMYRVGRMLPEELKETAQGGIAATPTARTIYQKIFGNTRQ